MLVPAAIYAWINWGDPVAFDGWAILVATDIAFVLALCSAFGARAPTSLKIFLLTLAIFDDLAAFAIIAVFYAADACSATMCLSSEFSRSSSYNRFASDTVMPPNFAFQR